MHNSLDVGRRIEQDCMYNKKSLVGLGHFVTAFWAALGFLCKTSSGDFHR